MKIPDIAHCGQLMSHLIKYLDTYVKEYFFKKQYLMRFVSQNAKFQ